VVVCGKKGKTDHTWRYMHEAILRCACRQIARRQKPENCEMHRILLSLISFILSFSPSFLRAYWCPTDATVWYLVPVSSFSIAAFIISSFSLKSKPGGITYDRSPELFPGEQE
jgi:hypothetical protein